MADQGTTHYGVLGISADGSADDIRRAYRAKAKLAHPDAGGDAAEFRVLLEAYETLIDEDRRDEYDRDRGIRRPVDGRTSGGTDGWAGNQGDFNANVGFPAWMNDVTDAQWRPTTAGEERETAYAATQRERAADAAAKTEAPPTNVVWWWPDQAMSAPVLAGALLIAVTTQAVVALDPFSGGEAWRVPVATDITGPVTIAGNTVAVWTVDGIVHGLELGRGVTKWETEVGPAAAAGLAATGWDNHERTGSTKQSDSRIVGARKDGRLFALAPETGTILWSTKLAGPATHAMAVSNGVVYVATSARSIEAVDLRKGKHRWRISLKSPVDLPPQITGEIVWLAGGGQAGALVRLDAATGRVDGTRRVGTAIGGMSSHDDWLWLTTSGPSRVLALDESGREMVAIDTDRVCAEPAVGTDRLYLVDPRGELLTYARTTGRLLARGTPSFEPSGAPQLVGDRLVMTASDGRIWASATS